MQIKGMLRGWESLRPNEDNTSWGIYEIQRTDTGSKETITAVGVLADSCRHTNMPLLLEGRLDDRRDRHGNRQFRFNIHVVQRPAGQFGTEAVLKTAPSVGDKTANKLWSTYGEDACSVLAETPEKAVDDGIIQAKHKDAISEAMITRRKEASFYAPLMTLFGRHGFPKNLPSQVLRKNYGDPVQKIKTNPFILLEFPGVGFPTVDHLRMALCLPLSMEARLMAGVTHAISQRSSHVWVSDHDLRPAVKEVLSIPTTDVDRVILLARHARDIVAKTDENGNVYYAITENASQEKRVNTRLISHVHRQGDWPKANISGDLTPHQTEQLEEAYGNGRVAVLCGSAGSGKTFTGTDGIMGWQKRGANILVCAPTGKAALRLTQAMRARGIQDLTATTIHRALKAKPSRSGFKFEVDGENEFLDADLVVIDELSMVGNYLGDCLLKAIPKSAHVLCLGDPNQLPSVGRGTLLRDWQTWCEGSPGYSYGLLTEIHRYGGQLIEACQSIYNGEMPRLYDCTSPGTLTWSLNNNLQFAPCTSNDMVIHRLQRFYAHVKNQNVTLKDNVLPDPVKDIQVVVAVNEKSPISREKINQRLQTMLNPKMVGQHDIYKVGDKIICTRNTWLPGDTPTSPRKFLANGSIGYVAESKQRYIRAKMDDYPGKILMLPTGAGKGDFDLAYAVTCHKMQGSQAPIVVVLLGTGYLSPVVDRGWLYTAVTRAQQLAVVLGSRSTMNKACTRTNMFDRHSFAHHYFQEA